MPETSDNFDDGIEEEWKVICSTKGEYMLGKIQARILQQAIAQGNRGIVMFKTFAISIPYIAEFYRVRVFLKDEKLLPERVTELPYVPISHEKWEKIKASLYEKIGKKEKNATDKT